MKEFTAHDDVRRHCPICGNFIERHSEVSRLSSNPIAVYHPDCLKSLLSFYKNKGEEPICPITKIPIDEAEIVQDRMKFRHNPVKVATIETQEAKSTFLA